MRRRAALVFVPAFAIFLYLLVELLAFVTLRVVDGRWFSFAVFQAERAVVAPPVATPVAAADADAGRAAMGEVVHPYLGFVDDPTKTVSDWFTRWFFVHPVNDYGFRDDKEPLQHRAPGTLLVGILGGSVAYALSAHGMATLREELARVPAFAGRDVVVVRLALAGYKEPQQLMTIAYLLALGAEFDVLVNLDGFNEVALPPVELVPAGTAPFFPRGWPGRAAGLPDLEQQRLAGEITYLEARRAARARQASAPPWRWSIAANLLWRLRDRALLAAMADAQRRLQRHRPEAAAYVARGPTRHYDDEAALMADLVAVWERSSRALAALARAHGVRYFHFLQPNQYVPGAKPMGPAERAIAISDAMPYRHGVERGYPLLAAAGRELAAAGIRFHDLTAVFADVAEPLYADSCCHLNDAGNARLGRAIGAAIAADVAAE